MVTDTERKTTGRRGEDAAACYLEQQGYRIAARNWSCKRGELDIVAEKGEIIAFVEVKTRKSGSLVSPLEAVSRQKQLKVISAALSYLAVKRRALQPRFDVAAVTERNGTFEVDYYEGAYSAGEFY